MLSITENMFVCHALEVGRDFCTTKEQLDEFNVWIDSKTMREIFELMKPHYEQYLKNL